MISYLLWRHPIRYKTLIDGTHKQRRPWLSEKLWHVSSLETKMQRPFVYVLPPTQLIHLLSPEAGFGRKKKGNWITMLYDGARIWQKPSKMGGCLKLKLVVQYHPRAVWKPRIGLQLVAKSSTRGCKAANQPCSAALVSYFGRRLKSYLGHELLCLENAFEK